MTTIAPPALSGLSHVALTVSDLTISVPWYERVFGQPAVLDEDTGPFRHVVFALGGTLFWIYTPSPKGRSPTFRSLHAGLASTTRPSPARTARNSNSGRRCWTHWVCSTAVSRTLGTAPGCRSRTPTGCRWRSSARQRPDRHPDIAP